MLPQNSDGTWRNGALEEEEDPAKIGKTQTRLIIDTSLLHHFELRDLPVCRIGTARHALEELQEVAQADLYRYRSRGHRGRLEWFRVGGLGLPGLGSL